MNRQNSDDLTQGSRFLMSLLLVVLPFGSMIAAGAFIAGTAGESS